MNMAEGGTLAEADGLKGGLLPCRQGGSCAGWIMRLFVMAAIVSGLLAGGAWDAAAQSGAGGFDHVGLARQMLEKYIRPGYERFKSRTVILQTTLDKVCRQHDEAGRPAIKAAFRDVLVAWGRIEYLRMGPVVEADRDDRIVSWPDQLELGKRQLLTIIGKRDQAVLRLDGLRKKDVAVQGLTALEVLLFGKMSGDLLKDSGDGRFMCGYARTIAANLSDMAQKIVAGWSDGGSFTAIWLKAGPQNTLYKSPSGQSNAILKAYSFGLGNLREVKLLDPIKAMLTNRNNKHAKRLRPEFAASGFAITMMIANIEGILQMFDEGGLAERLAVDEPETADLVRGELRAAIKKARRLEKLGEKAFVDKTVSKKLIKIGLPLKTALFAGGQALATEMGLVLGYTSDDGD